MPAGAKRNSFRDRRDGQGHGNEDHVDPRRALRELRILALGFRVQGLGFRV